MNNQIDPHQVAGACANCNAATSGNYCHQCGQETVLHLPSSREFMHEFIGHYVALEGKLWKSMGLLLFRPGRLTLEYINGRRVRYVQPLRMYLTFSLIFFAILKFSLNDANVHVGSGKHAAADTHEAAEAVKGADKTVVLVKEDKPGEIIDGTKEVSNWLKPRSAFLADRVAHFGELSFDERKDVLADSFYHYTPYAIFFMMPVFALYLKLLYLGSGRRYGEHLLFALHSNAFAYVAISCIVLASGFWWIKALLSLWLCFYLPMAMRRVYGGSRTVTALRWLALMFLHLMTMSFAIAGAVAFGLLH